MSINRDRDLPWSPSKRDSELGKQFSQVLYFADEPQGKRSYWAKNPRLERRFNQLIQDYPDYTKTDWLIHFLNRVCSNQDYELVERQLSLNHLAAFYQLEFYYAAKLLRLRYARIRELYPWEAIFDAITEPFIVLELSQKLLQKFDPKISTKKYIQTLCERRGRDWLRKKFGSHLNELSISITSSDPIDDREDRRSYSGQQQISERFSDAQETHEAQAQLKQDQHELWKIVFTYLEEVYKKYQTRQLKTFGKTPFTIWEALLITYGTNIGQSGTALIFTGNGHPVNQATLARKFQSFNITLFLKCRELLCRKIDPDALDKNLEQSEQFGGYLKEQHKTIGSLLKIYYQDLIYEAAIANADPQTICALDQAGLINALQVWFRSELNIQFDLDCLDSAKERKLHTVLNVWEQKFGIKLQ